MSHRTVPSGSAVTVEVPATTANLGPGFDCFGLALDWPPQQVTIEMITSGVQVNVTGLGAADVPRDANHLMMQALLTGLADLQTAVPGLRLSCHNTIPLGRGLGSSSAAIVAGLLAAQALAAVPEDRGWLLRQADALEGHPDNVAAAIHGGLVIAFAGHSGEVTAARARVRPEIKVALYIPDEPVQTTVARSLLPAFVPHADAAANAGRAGLLVHALGEEPSLLLEATRDWLHQSYRGAAMPQSSELLTRLRGNGYAAVISGAGPTVAVLGVHSQLAALRDEPGFELAVTGVGSAAKVIRHNPS